MTSPTPPEADGLRISVTLESRDSFPFAACCWHLHRLDPTAEAHMTVLNSRDVYGRRIVLTSQAQASSVWYRSALLDYAVDASDPLPTDGKPERFRRLRLRGPRGAVAAFVHESLDLYRRHVMSRAGSADEADDGVPYWTWDGDMWCRAKTRRPRPLDTLFLTAEAEHLIADFRAFCSDESLARYRELHVAPTRVYMLHGIPGSGKSSTVHCVASDMKVGVATMSFCGATTDADVRAALSALPPRCLLCIEDVDALFHDRRPTGGVTFSGLLAALDECGCLDEGTGTGVFLTTNRLCALDPALRRRIDYVLEFGHATKSQAQRMFQLFFPHSSAFEQLWQRLHGKRFAMSVLQKYLVKALQTGDPLRDFEQFDVLLECAVPADGDAGHMYT